jgi:hypothetical protein
MARRTGGVSYTHVLVLATFVAGQNGGFSTNHIVIEVPATKPEGCSVSIRLPLQRKRHCARLADGHLP